MALVVSSAPLAALWSKTEPVARDEKRPVECAAVTCTTSSSSSRRASTGSSGADTQESSSFGNSFGTQQSGSSTASKSATKQKARPRTRGADIVLHVQDCAFALHSRVLKRKCHVLYRFITQLRSKNAVGLLAGGSDDDDELEPLPLRVGLTSSLADHGEDQDDDTRFHSRDKQFALRQRGPLVTPRYSSGSAAHRLGRCPVFPRQQLSDRSTQSASHRSSRFPKVCCIAHKKIDDVSRGDTEASRPRLSAHTPEAFSPGKENYVGALATSSTVRTRALPHVALAPKMPFASTTSSFARSRQTTTPSPSLTASAPTATAAGVASSPSSSSSPREHTANCVAPNAFAVELVGATADAAATLVEFLYSGKTSGLTEFNAATVTSLCKWFCMEDHLLYAALIVRARNLHSAEQWMDILLCCTTLSSKKKKMIVINYLLRRLVALSSDQYRNVMDQMPLQRLSAIEDADVLSIIMTAMVNKMRRLEIWHKLTFSLELWMFWTFRRRFAAAVPLDHPHPVTVRQPLSLLDFHHKFVTWHPVLRVENVQVSGIDAYVKPSTIFSFGPFLFQVRLEPSRSPLMSWRVVRAGTPSDADDDPERCQFLPGLDPEFTLRGQLSILYKPSPTGPLRQDEVAIRYAHTQRDYGKWHVLLAAAPSVRTKQVVVAATEPESEEKTQEPDSSQEETAPLDPDSDLDIDRASMVVHSGSVAPSPQPGLSTPPATRTHTGGGEISGNSDDSPFEVMTSHLSGQIFVWGHRLCNLYHYLLVTTLFYQVPRGAPRALCLEATQTRMRELPVETIVLVLQSDRLRVPEGETTVAAAVAMLCLSDFGALHFSLEQIRTLFQCVRWTFVDLEQIMATLEHAPRELQLYELVEQQLRDHFYYGSAVRRTPWGVDDMVTPYRVATTLVEFQIEAGDRSLSPSKFLYSQE